MTTPDPTDDAATVGVDADVGALDEPAAGSQLRVLVMSMWPSAAAPEFGIFVKRQVERLRDAGVTVRVVGLTDTRSGRVRTPLKYLSLLLRGMWAVRTFRPDVVHGHFLLPTGDIARMVAASAGVPLAVTGHGTDVHNATTRPDGDLAARTRRVLRAARLVVSVSDEMAGDMRTLEPAVDPEVIDMGVDVRTFTTGGTTYRTPGASTALRVVAVGSLLPNKNHANLIRAVAAISGARLVIVGEGPARAALELLVDELGVGDRVALAGRLPATDVADWYRNMDVACLVSHREGFGLSALEAVACGCPVVVSSTTPVAAIVSACGVGEVVDPTDVEEIARGIVAAGRAGRVDEDARAAALAGRSVRDRADELVTALRGVVD